MHGGTAARGIDSHKWRGKGRTVDLPDRLAARVAQHLDDPDLTSLGRSIAVTRARLDELYAQFPTGEAGDAWAAVERANGELADAVAAAQAILDPDPAAPPADPADAEAAAQKLRAVIIAFNTAVTAGAFERGLWREIREVQDHERRQTEAELKRETALELMVPAKQVLTLLGVVKTAVLELFPLVAAQKLAVPDAQLSLARSIEKLIHRPGPAPKELPGGA